MKFLVDAQLPPRLAVNLEKAGHDTIHTLRMPKANRTGDGEIRKRSLQEYRIVISKDVDFLVSHNAIGIPKRLLHVKIGNTTAAFLNDLVMQNLEIILELFADSDLVEIGEGYVTSWPRSTGTEIH